MIEDGFRVDTPEKAAWAMRKYRALAQKRERNIELANAEKIRIEHWLERVNERIEGEMEFFGGHLEGFARSERAQGRKSVDLPDGKIQTRATGPGIALDKSTFVQWALEHEKTDLLRTTYAPDMDAIKDFTIIDGVRVIDKETGEVIEGAEGTPENVSVKITPDLDAIDLEGIDDDSLV